MCRGYVLDVVFVEVGVHPDASVVEGLVVLRARQRGQHGEFENVDRKLALDDLHVALDRRGRVARQAHDEAGIGNDAGLLPGLEHFSVFGDAVLVLLHVNQIVRVDAFQPDEGVGAAGAARLDDEVRDLMRQRVDLDQERDLHPIAFAQLDQPIEDRLPVPVAGEIVVGNEEARDALRGILAHDALDVVGVTPAGLAALHVDDGAERALERTAAARIERGKDAVVAPHQALRQVGDGLVLQVRQIVHVVIDRFLPAGLNVLQKRAEMLLGFAGEERDAEVDRLLQLRRQLLQHGNAAGDVKTADRHGHAFGAQAAGDRHRPRELVGLHADQADDPRMPRLLDPRGDPVDGNHRVHLVVGIDLDLDVFAQHLAVGAIRGDGIEARHRIGGNRGLPPLNDVALAVVVRRLDDLDVEFWHRPGPEVAVPASTIAQNQPKK